MINDIHAPKHGWCGPPSHSALCIGVGGRGKPYGSEVVVWSLGVGSDHSGTGLDNMHWEHCSVFSRRVLLLRICVRGETHVITHTFVWQKKSCAFVTLLQICKMITYCFSFRLLLRFAHFIILLKSFNGMSAFVSFLWSAALHKHYG